MLSRLAAPVTHFLKHPSAEPAADKGVPQLLAALAEVRAKKAELERQEQEILAATRDRLRKQQEELEELKRKVHDCGILVEEGRHAAVSPSAVVAESGAQPPSQPALSGN